MNYEQLMDSLKRPLPASAVAVLNDRNTVIVVDDGCYCVKNWNGNNWGFSAWIFPEAISVIKSLPDNPRDAKKIWELS